MNDEAPDLAFVDGEELDRVKQHGDATDGDDHAIPL